MSLTSWFLDSSGGTRHRLPREMIFVGRDDCELMLQSRSVDKQHAVINYNALTDEHIVKDLGSLNGTFVNDVRIPDQTYITLNLGDKLRFGYDTNLFTVVRGELKVPEEALKHEKFTSQLQIAQKQFGTDASKCKNDTNIENVHMEVHNKALGVLKTEEKNSAELSAVPRGTPLYGQPSWWGDEDEAGNTNKQESKEANIQDAVSTGCYKDSKKSAHQSVVVKEGNENSALGEPSYFEIPSKELQEKHENENLPNEVTSRDSRSASLSGAGHASFTIEFDEASPGKVTIKDHVTKFTDQRHKTKKLTCSEDKDIPGLKAEMIAAESKVADWLAQNNPPRLLKEAREEDKKSIKSDVPVCLKRLQGNKHEDGTQSDYENSTTLKLINKCSNVKGPGNYRHREQRRLDQNTHIGGKQQEFSSQTTFLIEFFDEDQKRKRRSHSFSLNSSTIGSETPYPIPKSRIDKVKALSDDPGGIYMGVQSGSSHRTVPSTHCAKVLHKDSQEPSSPLLLSENVLLRSSGSLGQRPANMQIKHSNAELHCVATKKKDSNRSEGGKCWASQHASLASNHVGHGQDNGQRENITSPSNNDADMSESEKSQTSESGQSDKKRRHLPKLPKKETNIPASPSKYISKSENGKKINRELQDKGSNYNLIKKDGLCGSGITAMNQQAKSLDNSIAEKLGARAYKVQHELPKEQKVFNKPPIIQSSVSVSSCRNAHKKMTDQSTEVVSMNIENNEIDRKETVKPLVRQGSFTKDKPSSNVPIELIPHIDKQHTSPTGPLTSVNVDRNDSLDTDSSMDTTLLLKDTEAVMAFLEAKLRHDSKSDIEPKTPSYSQGNSISPESDVDTASTISLIVNDTDKKGAQKRKNVTGLHEDKSSTSGLASKLHSSPVTLNPERIDRKGKTLAGEPEGRTETKRVFQSGRKKQQSMDLTDDKQTSNLRCSSVSDILSSGKMHASVSDPFIAVKSVAPNKPVALPKPRPTRTSLMRRSRLGEASDTEAGDTDRASVASEVSTTSSTSKHSTSKKTFSRIDLLAQPRRTRLNSLSTRSDSEAVITMSSGSSKTSEYSSRSGIKMTPTTDGRSSPRARANSFSRISDGKAKSVPPAYSSPAATSRWRRVDYASTSEDEFGSNRNFSKPNRMRTTSSNKILRSQVIGGSSVKTQSALSVTTSKHKAKEQDDYIRDWTAHREEIARISQDLALIAREINDVAGEIDSVTSSGTAPSTTVSTAATTPGSAIDTREELVDRVFDESLNFRKIPSSTPFVSDIHLRAGDSKPKSKEGSEAHVATRRKAWSRDEVMGDSLLLSSVFQFCRKIRQTTDKTANKIRILFKDKERNWDAMEKKFRLENEIPVLKTSCGEILSILQELKRIEKQLQAINTMIDPDGTLDALNMLGFGTSVPSSQQSTSGHTDNMSLKAVSQVDSITSRLKMTSVSSDVESLESSADFKFKRFNPDGKEDSTSQE